MLARRARDREHAGEHAHAAGHRHRPVSVGAGLAQERLAERADHRAVTARAQLLGEPEDVRLRTPDLRPFGQKQDVQNSSPSPVARRLEPSERYASRTCFAI